MAIGLFLDRILHMSLSLKNSNLGQLTYAAGLEIYRAGGFFQDPQTLSNNDTAYDWAGTGLPLEAASLLSSLFSTDLPR